jgi:hypothetical protein
MVAYNLVNGLAIRILDIISCERWSAEWMRQAELFLFELFKICSDLKLSRRERIPGSKLLACLGKGTMRAANRRQAETRFTPNDFFPRAYPPNNDISQTSTWPEKSHEATLLAQSYLKRARCFESHAAHALASCDAPGSLLLIVSCYIVHCC